MKKQILIIPVFVWGFLLSNSAQQYVKDAHGNFTDTLVQKDSILDNLKYSIKDRLNFRLSFSFNRINENHVYGLISWPPHPLANRLNARAECHYGVLDWLELGGYLGYTRHVYEWPLPIVSGGTFYGIDKMKTHRGFAPTFGLNANLHLLPFFGVKKDSKWEFYFTARYGGTYLRRQLETWISCYSFDSSTGKSTEILYFSKKRYRSEFGFGFGGGLYFWRNLGVYAEALAGEFCYFPETAQSYYTIRLGVEYKFMPKKQ